MSKGRWIFLFLAVDALLAVIFLPDWFVDPRERVLGEWQEPSSRLSAQVGPGEIAVTLPGSVARRLTYEWIDDKNSPYKCVVKTGDRVFPIELEFDGKDVALVRPDLSNDLSGDARTALRRWNRERGRPDDAALRWVRVRRQQSR